MQVHRVTILSYCRDNLEIMYKQLKKEKDLLDEKYRENEFILRDLDL